MQIKQAYVQDASKVLRSVVIGAGRTTSVYCLGVLARLYSSSSKRATSMFMNFVPMVNREPGVTWIRPRGRSSVAGATQTHVPPPSRRNCLMKFSTRQPPKHPGSHYHAREADMRLKSSSG